MELRFCTVLQCSAIKIRLSSVASRMSALAAVIIDLFSGLCTYAESMLEEYIDLLTCRFLYFFSCFWLNQRRGGIELRPESS